MVAADKAPWVAAFRVIHQRIAAVLAHVIEGFDAAILLAHHQNFFATHWFHLPIAGLGQFGLTSEEKPNTCPHALPFLLHEVAGGVAGAGDTVPANGLLRPAI